MNVDLWPDQDLVHAVLLPDLQEKHEDFYDKKTEFTEQQARQMDLAGLPILINHDEGLGQMGEAIAYAVRDKSAESKARAEVLFALDDPATTTDERHRFRLQFQQNALMNGAHRDVSLAHTYDVELVQGTVAAAASATSTGECVIKKSPFEISTCDEGKRTGSHVLAYLPSAKTLRRASEGAVRDFCRNHSFVAPPDGIGPQSAEWRPHIERLVDEIGTRRRQLFKRDVGGVHRASSDALNSIPWQFVNPDNVGAFSHLDLARMFALLLPQAPAQTPDSAAQPMQDVRTESATVPLETAAVLASATATDTPALPSDTSVQT